MRTCLSLMIVSTAILALAGLSPIAAQTGEATGEPSFSLTPATIASGATDVWVQLTAVEGDFFAQPSGRLPEVVFGDGVTLLETQYLSPKITRVRINVAATAFGAIPVSVRLYSLNGASVTILATGTLGVLGPAVLANDYNVSVSDHPTLVVDQPQPQRAGNITIEGLISGQVTVTADTGIHFSPLSPPTVLTTTTGVAVSAVTLAQDASSFTFVVDNPNGVTVTLELRNMSVTTAGFTALGGVTGAIAVTLNGYSFASPLVISHAHTQGDTFEDPQEEVVDETPTEDPSGTTGSTSNGTGYSSNNSSSSSSSSSTSRSSSTDDDTTTRDSRSTSSGSATNPRSQWGSQSSGRSMRVGEESQNPNAENSNNNSRASQVDGRGRAQRPNNRGSNNWRQAGSSSSRGRSNPSGVNGSTGTGVTGRAEYVPSMPHGARLFRVRLCDSGYTPLTALPLTAAGEGFQATVWFEIVLEADLQPTVQESITIRISLLGASHLVTLRETAANSGIYRTPTNGMTFDVSLAALTSTPD